MTDVKPKKSRKPKPVPEATGDLVAPMRWLMQAQKSGVGHASYQTHCRIGSGWAVAFDGAVAAGHRVPVDWFACPQTERFLAALERSTAGVSLVVKEDAITVKSGRLTVRVPCVDVLPDVPLPSPQAVGIDGSALQDAIRKVLPVCKESAGTVLETSIELANGCATATNRVCLLQAWHGLELPRMILPRASAVLLLKHDGMTGIAPDADKATFWFGPDKWLRFNLYDPGAYPNIDKIFNVQANPQPLPDGFKEGVAALLPHVGDDSLIRLGDFMDVDGGAARFDIATGENIRVKAELLKLVSEIATKIDFNVDGKIIFYGDMFRGALAHAGG